MTVFDTMDFARKIRNARNKKNMSQSDFLVVFFHCKKPFSPERGFFRLFRLSAKNTLTSHYVCGILPLALSLCARLLHILYQKKDQHKMKLVFFSIKHFVSVALAFSVVFSLLGLTVSAETLTQKSTSSVSNFAAYGFSNVPSSVYTKTGVSTVNTTGKAVCKVTHPDYGNVMCYMTTNYWALRQKSTTYDDMILTWAEIDPKTFTAKGLFGIKKTYQAVPADLSVYSLNLPSSVHYLSGYPKSQTTSYDYSLSFTTDSEGNVVPTVVENETVTSLAIKNQSSSPNNQYKVLYDYSDKTNSSILQYTTATTEQVGAMFVHSTKKNYSFRIKWQLNVVYTRDSIMYSTSYSTNSNRIATTNFS